MARELFSNPEEVDVPIDTGEQEPPKTGLPGSVSDTTADTDASVTAGSAANLNSATASYLDNYMGATNSQRARTSGDCSQRVMRGGSWFEIARLVRSSARYRHPPDTRRDSWGFRVAVDLN